MSLISFSFRSLSFTYLVFKMSSAPVYKIFDKGLPGSGFCGMEISLSTSSIFRSKLSCFLLSSRVFLAASLPNGVDVVAVVFNFGKLKLF